MVTQKIHANFVEASLLSQMVKLLQTTSFLHKCYSIIGHLIHASFSLFDLVRELSQYAENGLNHAHWLLSFTPIKSHSKLKSPAESMVNSSLLLFPVYSLSVLS